jgi:hypothetical protein
MKRTGNQMRYVFLCFVTIAVSLLVVSCSDDKPADKPTLSKAEFVERADSLCAETTKTIGAVVEEVFAAPAADPQDQQRALDKVITASRELHSELAALRPPAELSDAVREWLAALDAATDTAAAQSGADYWKSEDDPWANANAMAADLGLKACSGG